MLPQNPPGGRRPARFVVGTIRQAILDGDGSPASLETLREEHQSAVGITLCRHRECSVRCVPTERIHARIVHGWVDPSVFAMLGPEDVADLLIRGMNMAMANLGTVLAWEPALEVDPGEDIPPGAGIVGSLLVTILEDADSDEPGSDDSRGSRGGYDA
jgi:hypothetical protein